MAELPNALEPLVLADGRIVMPDGSIHSGSTRVPDEVLTVNGTVSDTPTSEPVFTPTPRPELVMSERRKLSDLPDTPRVMNAVCVIVAYSIFGLDDFDICVATGVTQEKLDKLRTSEAYGEMRKAIIGTILDAEAQSVRDMFMQKARSAVDVMAESMLVGKRADRISAAKDILDRAGHRPADVIEHRHRMDGGLTIEVVRKDERDIIPTIEMEDV